MTWRFDPCFRGAMRRASTFAELNHEDLTLVISFINTLVTETRLTVLGVWLSERRVVWAVGQLQGNGSKASTAGSTRPT